MKKILLSLFACGLISLLCAEEEFIIKNEKYNTNIKVLTNKQNGEEIKTVFNQNKEIKKIKTSFHKNGKIKKIEETKDNLLHGFTMEYYENGFLKQKTRYYKGLKNGVRSTYSDNGIVISEEEFANDVKNGYSILYNQGKKEKLIYKNGKLSNN